MGQEAEEGHTASTWVRKDDLHARFLSLCQGSFAKERALVERVPAKAPWSQSHLPLVPTFRRYPQPPTQGRTLGGR